MLLAIIQRDISMSVSFIITFILSNPECLFAIIQKILFWISAKTYFIITYFQHLFLVPYISYHVFYICHSVHISDWINILLDYGLACHKGNMFVWFFMLRIISNKMILWISLEVSSEQICVFHYYTFLHFNMKTYGRFEYGASE